MKLVKLKIVKDEEFNSKKELLIAIVREVREQAITNPTSGSPAALIAAYDALLAEIAAEMRENTSIRKVA